MLGYLGDSDHKIKMCYCHILIVVRSDPESFAEKESVTRVWEKMLKVKQRIRRRPDACRLMSRNTVMALYRFSRHESLKDVPE